MQHAAFGVHLVEFHPASLGHAQPMPEDQQQHATVAGLITAPLRGLDQPFNLAPGEVLALAVVAGRCLVGERVSVGKLADAGIKQKLYAAATVLIALFFFIPLGILSMSKYMGYQGMENDSLSAKRMGGRV